MQQIIEENKGIIKFILLFVAIFLVAASISKLKEYRYIGTGTNNTITVQGTGKIDRAPDTAKISFTVEDEQKDLKTAQDNVSKKIDAVTRSLKDQGIEEKYIKTDSYNSYPQYDYPQTICTSVSCPKPSSPVLRGYRVSHAITVNVKNLDSVSSILATLGTAGVTNVSGPNFGFEDDMAVVREARDAAIKDAKAQAKVLAKSLGVRTVRIVSFSENGSSPISPLYMSRDMVAGKAESAALPTVPVGEQNIESNVTITYEIQ